MSQANTPAQQAALTDSSRQHTSTQTAAKTFLHASAQQHHTQPSPTTSSFFSVFPHHCSAGPQSGQFNTVLHHRRISQPSTRPVPQHSFHSGRGGHCFYLGPCSAAVRRVALWQRARQGGSNAAGSLAASSNCRGFLQASTCRFC